MLLVGAVVASIGAGAAVASRAALSETVRKADLEAEAVFVDPTRVPGLHLGAPGAVAALLWMHTIEQFGAWYAADRLDEDAYHKLARQVEAIATLDPMMRQTYLFSGAVLLPLGGTVYETHRTFLRALTGQSGNWELYFYIGSMYYEAYGDLDKTGRWWLLASALPGSPDYLANLAEFLVLRESGDAPAELEQVIDTLRELPPELQEERTQLAAYHRARQRWERDLRVFEQHFGRPPRTVTEVVDAGIWRTVPID
ncbi:MAG: hypothetical protein D6761_01815, partial [Candidatus Dadabacteria bacterium]